MSAVGQILVFASVEPDECTSEMWKGEAISMSRCENDKAHRRRPSTMKGMEYSKMRRRPTRSMV